MQKKYKVVEKKSFECNIMQNCVTLKTNKKIQKTGIFTEKTGKVNNMHKNTLIEFYCIEKRKFKKNWLLETTDRKRLY